MVAVSIGQSNYRPTGMIRLDMIEIPPWTSRNPTASTGEPARRIREGLAVATTRPTTRSSTCTTTHWARSSLPGAVRSWLATVFTCPADSRLCGRLPARTLCRITGRSRRWPPMAQKTWRRSFILGGTHSFDTEPAGLVHLAGRGGVPGGSAPVAEPRARAGHSRAQPTPACD